jgi:hypothetical protein
VSTTLQRFDDAVVSFRNAAGPLGVVNIHSDSSVDARIALLQHELGAGGSRIISFASVLRGEHAAAVEAQHTFHAERDKAEDWTKSYHRLLDHWGRLRSCYEAIFLFVRSYQDSLCRALLRSAGQEWGLKTSMVDAVKIETVPDTGEPASIKRKKDIGTFRTTHPASKLLIPKVPGYADWFAQWRFLRNRMKTGSATTGFGQGDDLGIIVSEVRPTGSTFSDTTKAITLATVAEALELSASVAEIAAQTVPSTPEVAGTS